MRKKREIFTKICKICKKEYETVSETSLFCSNECKVFYARSPEGRKEQSLKTKKQWEENPLRKITQFKKIKETKSKDPERYKNISRENLRKHIDLHRGKGNGKKHTEEHKNYMKRLFTGRVFSEETIDRMKKGHWSKKENREDVILKCRETKNKRIASGEITFNNLGVSGKYKSLKTSLIESYDSLTEAYRMIQLDKDDSVIYWTKKHKIKIPYLIEGRKRDYIPDFLIITNEGKTIEEIKSSWSEKLHGELNPSKKESLKLFSKENNFKWEWKVIDLKYEELKELKKELKKITI